jgi:hypothetical protein
MQQTAHKSIGTTDNTPNSHEWELSDLARKYFGALTFSIMLFSGISQFQHLQFPIKNQT